MANHAPTCTTRLYDRLVRRGGADFGLGARARQQLGLPAGSRWCRFQARKGIQIKAGEEVATDIINPHCQTTDKNITRET
jgi:hypothetical protein